jgi:hypothetical protein
MMTMRRETIGFPGAFAFVPLFCIDVRFAQAPHKLLAF